MTKTVNLTPDADRSLKTELQGRSRGRREALRKLAPVHHPARNDLTPKLHLVDRAPGDLVIPARNVRKIDPAHLREVANAIAALGFCDPVLIDEHNNMLDGVVRVAAAKQLGLASIPCVRGDHLTDSEKRLARIALNRTSENGIWDFGALKIEVEQLIMEDAPIEIAGFSLTEIDQILLDEEASVVEAGPLAPEPDAIPIARIGDHFILGDHEVICGDATDPRVLATLMGDQDARLLLTDEPYNVAIAGNVTQGNHREFPMASGEMTDPDFERFNDAWMEAGFRHLCDGGLFGTYIDWRGYHIVHAAASKLGLCAINLIVWTKTNAGMGSLYRSQHELLPLYKKGKTPHTNNIELGKHGRWRSNHWTYPGASSIGSDARRGLQDHPTVKPVAMLEDALLDLTHRGDVVLDPFLGSGSMLIAAEKSGRQCRGVELDPLYVDVIVRRYENITGKFAIVRGTGETFEELAARRKYEAERPAQANGSD